MAAVRPNEDDTDSTDALLNEIFNGAAPAAQVADTVMDDGQAQQPGTPELEMIPDAQPIDDPPSPIGLDDHHTMLNGLPAEEAALAAEVFDGTQPAAGGGGAATGSQWLGAIATAAAAKAQPKAKASGKAKAKAKAQAAPDAQGQQDAANDGLQPAAKVKATRRSRGKAKAKAAPRVHGEQDDANAGQQPAAKAKAKARGKAKAKAKAMAQAAVEVDGQQEAAFQQPPAAAGVAPNAEAVDAPALAPAAPPVAWPQFQPNPRVALVAPAAGVAPNGETLDVPAPAPAAPSADHAVPMPARAHGPDLPVARTGGADFMATVGEEIRCDLCELPTVLTKVRIVGKSSCPKVQCNACSRTLQICYRATGSTKLPGNMPAEKLAEFMRSSASKCPEKISADARAVHDQYKVVERTFAEDGQYLPLSVWKTQGFDIDTIVRDAKPEDVVRGTYMLGDVYRVPIYSRGKRGVEGERVGDTSTVHLAKSANKMVQGVKRARQEAASSSSAAAAAGPDAPASEPALVAAEIDSDAEVCSSTSSSSSSSTHDKKKKKKKSKKDKKSKKKAKKARQDKEKAKAAKQAEAKAARETKKAALKEEAADGAASKMALKAMPNFTATLSSFETLVARPCTHGRACGPSVLSAPDSAPCILSLDKHCV